ncbi:hypothetical protein D3C77_791480 [compost metagenome]
MRSENALKVARPTPLTLTGVNDSTGRDCACTCTSELKGSSFWSSYAKASNGLAISSDVEIA